jgi:hypothetical protein
MHHLLPWIVDAGIMVRVRDVVPAVALYFWGVVLDERVAVGGAVGAGAVGDLFQQHTFASGVMTSYQRYTLVPVVF